MNVLIVRLGALGDIVHAIPAAAALRAAYPDARIDWLVDAKHRAIVDLVTSVDRVVTLERSTLAGWSEIVRTLRQVRYDWAIDFQGLLKSAVLARASGANRVAGFSIWHLREKAARPFYTDAGESASGPGDPNQRGGGHVIRKNLRLLRALGIDDDRITFPLATTDSPAVASVRATLGGRIPFALINPGAAWPNKRWPPERFAEVAAFLRDVRHLPSFVLWGPGEKGAGGGSGRSVGRCRAARSTDEPRRHSRTVSSGRIDGVRRYGAAPYRYRGRDADAFSVWPDRPRSQRSVGAGRSCRVAIRFVPVSLPPALPRAQLVHGRDRGSRGHRRICSSVSRHDTLSPHREISGSRSDSCPARWRSGLRIPRPRPSRSAAPWHLPARRSGSGRQATSKRGAR